MSTQEVQDHFTPVATLSNGAYEEVISLGPSGELRFAESDVATTLGPGGLDPQDAPKLLGEKTAVVEATYGDVELGEFDDEFRDREALVLFMRMETDASVRQGLMEYENAAFNARWRIIPASSDPKDLEIAAACADDLGLGDMRAGKYSFRQLISLGLSSAKYKRAIGELCFAQGADRIVLDKVIPMSPLTIEGIEYDNKGGPKNVLQKGKIRGEQGKQIDKKIPVFKTVIFTNADDGINEGESILRPAVIHWRIKRALMILMNQGLERFALGIPMLRLPATVMPKTAQWEAARKLCIDYVTKPRTGVLVPAGWEFEVITLKNSMPDIIPYIEYHDRCILRSLGLESSSVGLKEGQSAPSAGADSAGAAVESMLGRIASTINLYVIPKIVVLNWPDVTRYPRLVAEFGDKPDASAAANLFGMLLNAAVDLTIAEQQAELQREQAEAKLEADAAAAKAAGAGGKAGAVSGGASRSGAGRTPSAKFAEAAAESADPSALGEKVASALTTLRAALPTSMRRLLGYLEDEQREQLDPYRSSAQTVRTVDARRPVPSGART